MASEEKIEKPAWMFYFDGPFYDNYVNDLKRLNIAKIQNNFIEESNKNRPSILKHTHPPTLFDTDQYIHNGIQDIPSLSKSELEWRKRRTNGIVVIAILLIAGIATATALITHLVFIEGKDPFEIPDLSDNSLHRRRHTTTTILPIITNSGEGGNKRKDSRGHDDVTTQSNVGEFSTASHKADDKTDSTQNELNKDVENKKKESKDNVLTNKTENIKTTSTYPIPIEIQVTEYYIHPESSTEGRTQIPAISRSTTAVNIETGSTYTVSTTVQSTSLQSEYKRPDSTTRSYESDSITLSTINDITDIQYYSTTPSTRQTGSTTLSVQYNKTESTTFGSTDRIKSLTLSTQYDKSNGTTLSSDKPVSTSEYKTYSTTSSSTGVRDVSTTLRSQSEISDSVTTSSNKTDSTTSLISQNDKIGDVMITQSTTSNYLPSDLAENATTLKPQSKIVNDQNANEEAFNFVILDKAGTTLDVDSGNVISAADSPHTFNNTNVIVTAGMNTHRQQAQIQVIMENSTSADFSDPEIFCKHYPADLMVDPTNCARYYNCSDPSIKLGLEVKYLHECRYPRLFKDVQTGCVLFLNVTCADRHEPKAPCEYVENMCFGDTCEPCEEIYPSCVGKENGTFEYSKNEDGSTKYIACFEERTVGQMTCQSGTYDRKTKKCVDSK